MNTSEINNPMDKSWFSTVMKYNRPELKKSIWQIINSLVPYVILWYLMYKSMEYPYWVTILLSIVASGFLIRLFIIFHDCGHGSFFKSKNANLIIGAFLGILAFTPYHKWHIQHSIHHATSGNLDKRGIGDVWTMTVEEYKNSTSWQRFIYKAFRNPIILFVFGPILVVFGLNRLTSKSMSSKEKNNIYFTNTALILIATGISLVIGLKTYLLIQLPVILIAHVFGLWLFYIQHQFDDVSWTRTNNWDYKTAALKGSSFFKLPGILQWFSGNIGFHHVHHLSSKIPNYNLAKCHYENELFKNIKPITFLSALKTIRLNLWDEINQKMVSFREIKTV